MSSPHCTTLLATDVSESLQLSPQLTAVSLITVRKYRGTGRKSHSGVFFTLSDHRYFIHDSLDIIICRQSRASWEYLVHHAVASSGGEGRLWGRRRGWPVSNIFLTLRMMMRLGKLPSPPSTRSTSTSTWPPLPLPPGPKAYLTWFFAPRGDARQAPFLMVNLVLLDAMILMYFSRLRARLLSGGHRRLGRRRST
uniref:Uncharacterized protein n=1 Tax=Naja naja TaxID=35670 RepID=A0A8C6V6W0_NAJNA